MTTAIDERARARVLQYIADQGGAIIEAGPGGVTATEMPSWESIVNVCTLMALDAAEYQPTIVSLAHDLGTPERALAWVQATIEWRDEPGERLSYPTTTIKRGWGDCDCSATVLSSLFTALGYRSAVICLTLDGVPVHGCAALERGHAWWWADGTEAGPLRPWSRHPLTADERPGRRGVISPDVVTVPRWP